MLNEFIANQYLRAFIVFLLVFVISRVGFSILTRVLLKLTTKTKTDLDDLIIKKSSIPLTIILFLVSINVGLGELSLEEKIAGLISKGISSIEILLIAYMIYTVIDVIFLHAWHKFASKTKTDMDDNLVSLVHGIMKVLFFAIVLLYILDLWGIQIGSLLAGLGIAGLAVALALQPTLSNIFSGVSIILDKSVRKGDLIYLNDSTKGKILKVGLRSTKIVTFDNELIIVPNTKLADSVIQNIALPEPKTRVVIQFSVAYGSKIEKVKSIVIKEIKSIKGVSKDPEPVVRFTEMASSSLNFKAYFYVDHFENKWEAIDQANTKIYDALNKAKIEIPFPQMDVRIKKK